MTQATNLFTKSGKVPNGGFSWSVFEGFQCSNSTEICANLTNSCCCLQVFSATTRGSSRTVTDRGNAPFEYASAVTYSCRNGRELRGSQRLMCRSDGTWNTELPTCVCELGQFYFFNNGFCGVSCVTDRDGTAVQVKDT